MQTQQETSYILKIEPWDFPESPRGEDSCNLGKIYAEHRRYTLKDADASDVRDEKGRVDEKKHIVMDLYMYEHGGVALNTTGFSCGWDSGLIGYIYVEREEVRRIFGVKRISKKLYRKVEEILRDEVETFSQYLNGEVYAYSLIDKASGEEIESCAGFYGQDPHKNGMFKSLDLNPSEVEVQYA